MFGVTGSGATEPEQRGANDITVTGFRGTPAEKRNGLGGLSQLSEAQEFGLGGRSIEAKARFVVDGTPEVFFEKLDALGAVAVEVESVGIAKRRYWKAGQGGHGATAVDVMGVVEFRMTGFAVGNDDEHKRPSSV